MKNVAKDLFRGLLFAVAFIAAVTFALNAFADEPIKFSELDATKLENIALKLNNLQVEANNLAADRVAILARYHLHFNKDGKLEKDAPPAAAKAPALPPKKDVKK